MRILFNIFKAAFLAFLAFGILLSFRITRFAGSPELARGDYALVLGAGSVGERPSPVFRERIHHALYLYRMGRVKKLLFSGRGGVSPSQAEVARRYALGLGVPEADILTEGRSETTLENLTFSRSLDPGAHFVIVSDPLHLWRASRMAGDLGMSYDISPTPSTRIRGQRERLYFLFRELLTYAYYESM